MGMVTLKIEGNTYEYESGTTYEVVANDFQASHNELIALVIENGKLKELSRKVEVDAEVEFVLRNQAAGQKTYARTAILVLVKAANDVLGGDPDKQLKVEFTVGNGFIITPKGFEFTDSIISDIKKRMQEIIDANMPIKKMSMPTGEAMNLFGAFGMDDKVKLFRYRRGNTVNMYELDGYYDYYYGYMLPKTGYVKKFDFIGYKEGAVLLVPKMYDTEEVPVFKPKEKLYNALMSTTKLAEAHDISTVGALNDRICKGSVRDIVMISEARQERRIAEIAKEIYERKGVKFVMIAGPSSSGKTSFSHRLSIQLSSYGLKPHPIAVDDYFVNREDTPVDENGDFDFECIEALDIESFNNDMLRLLNGERVEIPTFNFKLGKREYKGNFKQLGEDDILVIEGIHALNDKMSYALPGDSKFKIYISALTSLNIDEHNRIPTTDCRLLRRMVRDARTRGTSAQGTIKMWQSVRRGEEKNIFPYQESADATFNSSLEYELSVIKTYAEPLLFAIDPGEPEYFEAKRLLKFLEYFLAISSEGLPNNSLVREFVGGSIFPV